MCVPQNDRHAQTPTWILLFLFVTFFLDSVLVFNLEWEDLVYVVWFELLAGTTLICGVLFLAKKFWEIEQMRSIRMYSLNSPAWKSILYVSCCLPKAQKSALQQLFILFFHSFIIYHTTNHAFFYVYCVYFIF